MTSIPRQIPGILTVAGLDIGIRSMVQQQFACFQSTSVGGQHERGPSILIEHVQIRSMTDQLGHDLDMPRIARQQERRLLGIVLLVHIDLTQIDDQSTDRDKTIVGGDYQRGYGFLEGL